MMFIPLVIAAAAGIAAIIIFLLKWEKIVSWFQKTEQEISLEEADEVGVIVKDKMDNGEYTVINGIFNKRTAKFKMNEDKKVVQKYKAKKLDDTLEGFQVLTIVT